MVLSVRESMSVKPFGGFSTSISDRECHNERDRGRNDLEVFFFSYLNWNSPQASE